MSTAGSVHLDPLGVEPAHQLVGRVEFGVVLEFEQLPVDLPHVLGREYLLQVGAQVLQLEVVLALRVRDDRDPVLRLEVVRVHRVVHQHQLAQLPVYYPQVLYVVPVREVATFPVQPVLDVFVLGVELVDDLVRVACEAGREHDHLEEFGHTFEELLGERADVDSSLDLLEIGHSDQQPGVMGLGEIVNAVDEGLVEIQHQGLPAPMLGQPVQLELAGLDLVVAGLTDVLQPLEMEDCLSNMLFCEGQVFLAHNCLHDLADVVEVGPARAVGVFYVAVRGCGLNLGHEFAQIALLLGQLLLVLFVLAFSPVSGVYPAFLLRSSSSLRLLYELLGFTFLKRAFSHFVGINTLFNGVNLVLKEGQFFMQSLVLTVFFLALLGGGPGDPLLLVLLSLDEGLEVGLAIVDQGLRGRLDLLPLCPIDLIIFHFGGRRPRGLFLFGHPLLRFGAVYLAGACLRARKEVLVFWLMVGVVLVVLVVDAQGFRRLRALACHLPGLVVLVSLHSN
jgi:hypothetical protein